MKDKILISLIATFVLLGCKKNRQDLNIIESSIDFNNDTISVVEQQGGNIFQPGSVYRSYFSAAGLAINGQYFFIGTQSKTDDDFGAADLQIIKTNAEFNWFDTQKLFRSNEAKLNSVSPTLIKVGNIYQFYYLRQESFREGNIYMMESDDQGETWKNERRISFVPGFNLLTNDRIAVLSSGRIIIPVSFTSNIDGNYNDQYIFCYYSDDKGKTWQKTGELKSRIPLMEPSVAEFGNGNLLMVIRSTLGRLLFARSFDNGMTWSTIEKSHLNSPSSTSALYRLQNGVLGLIWNNTAPYNHVHDRRPLSLSVSKDGGKSWSRPYNIGKTPDELYSSPGMFPSGNDWVIYFNYSTNAADYGIRAKKLTINF